MILLVIWWYYSGVAISYIIYIIIGNAEKLTLAELIITGIVASMTVGGKSCGKNIAIKFSNYIVYWISIILEFMIINKQRVIHKIIR